MTPEEGQRQLNLPDVNAAIDAAERRIVKAITSAEASIRRAITSSTTDAELRDLQRYVRIGAEKVDTLSTKTTAHATSQETLINARWRPLKITRPSPRHASKISRPGLPFWNPGSKPFCTNREIPPQLQQLHCSLSQ